MQVISIENIQANLSLLGFFKSSELYLPVLGLLAIGSARKKSPTCCLLFPENFYFSLY